MRGAALRPRLRNSRPRNSSTRRVCFPISSTPSSTRLLYAGHDPGARCRYQQAIVQWLLGYPERAATLIRDAQHLSDQLRHPFTGTATLWSSVWLHYQRGERAAAARTSLRMRELAQTHGIVHWLDASIVMPHVIASNRLDAKVLAEMHCELMRVAARYGVACSASACSPRSPWEPVNPTRSSGARVGRRGGSRGISRARDHAAGGRAAPAERLPG
jgi:hypothetical protein